MVWVWLKLRCSVLFNTLGLVPVFLERKYFFEFFPLFFSNVCTSIKCKKLTEKTIFIVPGTTGTKYFDINNLLILYSDTNVFVPSRHRSFERRPLASPLRSKDPAFLQRPQAFFNVCRLRTPQNEHKLITKKFRVFILDIISILNFMFPFCTKFSEKKLNFFNKVYIRLCDFLFLSWPK